MPLATEQILNTNRRFGPRTLAVITVTVSDRARPRFVKNIYELLMQWDVDRYFRSIYFYTFAESLSNYILRDAERC